MLHRVFSLLRGLRKTACSSQDQEFSGAVSFKIWGVGQMRSPTQAMSCLSHSSCCLSVSRRTAVIMVVGAYQIFFCLDVTSHSKLHSCTAPKERPLSGSAPSISGRPNEANRSERARLRRENVFCFPNHTRPSDSSSLRLVVFINFAPEI